MHSYEVRRLPYFFYLAGVSAVAIGAIAVILVPDGPNVEKGPVWVMVAFAVIACCGVYTSAAMPLRIDLTDAGTLKFTSLLGIHTAGTHELTKVATESMNFYVVFHFSRSRVRALNRIEGLYELASTLKTRLPNLMIQGL